MQELVKGCAMVLGPDEGSSYWQPGPHFGHMTTKVSPQDQPSIGFSMGTQLLPPGCHVREHGHAKNEEVLFIYEGTGHAIVDGQSYPIEPGSTIIVGPYVAHTIVNEGASDMKLVWFFTPPGLENVVQAAGRRRVAGEPAPSDVVRPDNMAQVLKDAGYATPEEISLSVRK